MFLQVFIVIIVQGCCQSLDLLKFRNDHIIFFNRYLRRELTFDTIDQKIDHFNESDHRTFKMKYHKSMELWKPGGPILLYIGGESPIGSYKSSSAEEDREQELQGSSVVNDIIEETNAAYYVLEHRYYGESKPFENPTVDDLKYLSSKQVLADVAYVLQTLKASKEFNNSKVIVMGGSYSANLAAWMKVMYPNLVDAVYSSSGPLLAKKHFYEYFEGVTETFKTYGSQDCVDKISTMFNSIQELLQSPEGIAKLKNKYNICPKTDMTVPENQQVFFMLLTDNYAGHAQYGKPNSIREVCKQEILHFLSLDMNNEEGCYDLDFNTVIRYIYKESLWLWLYQTCTEFGYFQTTTSINQMFGKNTVPLEFYLKTCKVIFGEEFDEQRVDQGVNNTNKMYGGLTPNVKNVVFVNGDMDPWHKLGVLQDLSAESPAVYITGSSHCHDLDLRNEDEDNVNEARDRIKNYLKQWIGAQT